MRKSRRPPGHQVTGSHVIYFLLLIPLFCLLSPVYARDWQKLDSDHFVIYHTGEQKFAGEVARNAESYYKRIAVGLGYPRYSQFWTWDKKVKIYIYPDHASYIKASEQPEWSHGMADYREKMIMSYPWSEMFIESILPHEIAHLIFRDFVGFTGKIPLWLDEGVAQWAEDKKRKELKEMAKSTYDQDKLLSLDDVMHLDIQRFKDVSKIYIRPTKTKDGSPATLILDTNSLVSSYYLAAVSLIDFLIDKYGSDRFAQFCRELRDGKTVEESLKFTYSTRVKSIDQLERKWRKHLAED
jgi:hypothetical protein